MAWRQEEESAQKLWWVRSQWQKELEEKKEHWERDPLLRLILVVVEQPGHDYATIPTIGPAQYIYDCQGSVMDVSHSLHEIFCISVCVFNQSHNWTWRNPRFSDGIWNTEKWILKYTHQQRGKDHENATKLIQVTVKGKKLFVTWVSSTITAKQTKKETEVLCTKKFQLACSLVKKLKRMHFEQRKYG